MDIGAEVSPFWPQNIVIDGVKYQIEYEIRDLHHPLFDPRIGHRSHVCVATTMVNGKRIYSEKGNAIESVLGLAEAIKFLTGSSVDRVSVDMPISYIKRNSLKDTSLWSR